MNESAGTVQMQGGMSLYDCNSRVVTQQTTTLEIAPYTVVKAFDVPAVKENTFLYLKLNDEKEHMLSIISIGSLLLLM